MGHKTKVQKNKKASRVNLDQVLPVQTPMGFYLDGYVR